MSYEDYCRRAVEDDPTSFDAWLGLSGCWLYLGSYDDACRAGERAGALQPSHLLAAVIHAAAADALLATAPDPAAEDVQARAAAAMKHLQGTLAATASDAPCGVRVAALDLGARLCRGLGDPVRAQEFGVARDECTEEVRASGSRGDVAFLERYMGRADGLRTDVRRSWFIKVLSRRPDGG